MAAQTGDELAVVLAVLARTNGSVDFNAVAVSLSMPDAATA